MAKLRHAAASAPGEVPSVWDLTAVDPAKYANGTERSGRVGDQPTPEELAAHTVMTLYAVHQQSRQQGMHRPGWGLGYAARELIGTGDEEQASKRARFDALVTSSTTAELRRHLRTFISLLRTEEIPLDYAMLADDLISFQYPGGPKEVRLRWSRQYYRIPPQDDGAPSSSDISDNTHNGEQAL
ncbi:type I-E CRISPR-associated protein Cse2/CasB [Actinobaculum sp. 313]|nr:type I-E CRISPR-associated protein Cse2/CasB [Actinobaculum sp. 313]